MSPADGRSEADPIIELRGLRKAFRGQPVLQGVDLAIPSGRALVVMGPSGCGKSVMLKHLVGLLRPDEGEIRFHGERIDELNERELVPIRRRIGFLFQQAALFDSLTVRENVAFSLRETGQAGPDLEDRVRTTLARVGLEDALDRMPAELSGGMRKRVGLARAIVLEPEVVLYDEPTTGLDPIRANVINDLIVRLQADLAITSVVVTHDLDSAFQVADRMVLLHEGKVRIEGSPDELRTSEDPVLRSFLEGREFVPDSLGGDGTDTLPSTPATNGTTRS
ncbi:MAG: ABC transporter ATP-binding protein [Planctomycetota bacterium]|nr:ABC transporter ATP-binding protein [Planctomycetota bacterium]